MINMGRVKRINMRSFFVIFDLMEFPFKFTITHEIFVPIRLGLIVFYISNGMAPVGFFAASS